MPSALCSLQGVHTRPGDAAQLEDVSFEVHAGEILGVLATEPAEARSLLELLTGIRAPDAGSVRLLDEAAAAAPDPVRRRIGARLLPVTFLRHSTVREVVAEIVGLYADGGGAGGGRGRGGGATSGQETGPEPGTGRAGGGMEELLDAFELTSLADRDVGDLGPDETHRLSLALALQHRPDVLVVENPSFELGPAMRRVFWERAGVLARRGGAVVFSTPFAGETHLCHRVLVLHRGRIRALGSPAELLGRFGKGFVVEFVPDRPVDPADLERMEGVRDVEVTGADHRVQVTDLRGVAALAELLAEHGPVHDFRTRVTRLEEMLVDLAGEEPEESAGGDSVGGAQGPS